MKVHLELVLQTLEKIVLLSPGILIKENSNTIKVHLT